MVGDLPGKVGHDAFRPPLQVPLHEELAGNSVGLGTGIRGLLPGQVKLSAELLDGLK